MIEFRAVGPAEPVGPESTDTRAVLTQPSGPRVRVRGRFQGNARRWRDSVGRRLPVGATIALLQYVSLDKANLRLNFIHRPGSDLFIVLTERRGVVDRLGDLSSRDWQRSSRTSRGRRARGTAPSTFTAAAQHGLDRSYPVLHT